MAASDYAERPEILAFRVGENARKIGELERWRSEVDKSDAAAVVTVERLQQDMRALVEAVEGLRKMFLGFALTLAGSAVVFALSVLAASGRI